MNLNKIKNEILIESESYVIRNGWNQEMLFKLANNSKYGKDVVFSLFPEGYISLTQLYLDKINIKMTNESQKLNLIRLKVHERIRELCILRFKIMNKEKNIIKKTFFHLLLPNNYIFCLKNLYKSVDQIWYLSGDSSTDFNFYSKRAILASIYSNTIIHFINNEDLEETIKLLDRQLKIVSKIPKIKNRLSDFSKLSSEILKFRKNSVFFKQ